MMYRKMLVSVVVLYALLAMLFISDTGNVAISAVNSNPAASPGPAQTNEMTSDDRLAEVGKQVSGFGGMFYDQDGTLQVYLLEQKGPVSDALMASLDEVITREIGGGERLSSKGVEILEAQYSFLDLYSWHQQMSPAVLALDGVISTDIADGENRLRIGITDSPGALEAVEKQLSGLGIPRE